jgi:5-methylcytosine-specific restriction protein B
VNQGRTYEVELARGYLFAPLRDKLGRRLDHWEAMAELRPGDIVIHYARGAVHAVSTVRSAATSGSRPVPLPEPWLNIGRYAAVETTPATVPVPLSSIPRVLRGVRPHGPFDVRGEVRQAYLFPVTPEFASAFFGQFGARFGKLHPVA